jgi:hypothetical protein
MKKFIINTLFIFISCFIIYEVLSFVSGTSLNILLQRFAVQLLDSDNHYPCMQGGWVTPLPTQTVNLYSPAAIQNLLAQIQKDLPQCKKILRADQILHASDLVAQDQSQLTQAINNQQQLKQALMAQKNNPALQWVSPTQATFFVAGMNKNNKLYVCQAAFNGNLYPGQYSNQGCIITYGGRSYTTQSYTLLNLFKPAQWRSSSTSLPNSNIIIPGGTENYHTIGICRAYVAGELHLGKIINTGCNIAVDQQEIVIRPFEFLTY